MSRRKFTLPALILALIIGFSGCNIVQVNPEKDMERVVFETKDEEVPKKTFVEMFTYYEMIAQLNGQQMPTDEQLVQTKEDLLNTLVEVKLLSAEGKANKVEVASDEIKQQADATISSLQSGFETEEKYVEFITERNLTQEEFESFLQSYVEAVAYANAYSNAYTEELAGSGEEAKKVAVKVNGADLTKDELYYNLSQLELQYYTMTGSGLPTDEESMNSVYQQVQDQMAIDYLVREDAEKKGIKVGDEELAKKQEEVKSQVTSFYGDDLSDYLKSYYLTEERYDELTRLDALTTLYEEAMKEDFKKDIKVSEKEIEDYYNENKASYDTSTISAKHILTENEDLAKTIKGEITDGASFEAALEKYKDNEEVTEATDLGEFGKGKMVAEFEDAAFALDKGQVSDIVKTEYGYHIIYVYDKNIKELPTLEEKSEEIKGNLMTQKSSDQWTTYQDELVKNAEVKNEEIVDPFQTFIEDLKETYQVKTYPKVL